METLAVIRDIAIIFLALLNIIFMAILVIIAIQAWRLVRYLMRELPEFAGAARQTLTRVEGTADFLGTTAARPAIKAAGFAAALQSFFRALASGRGGVRMVR